MKPRATLIVAAALLCAIPLGCTRRITSFPALSTKPLDAPPVNLDHQPSLAVDSGVDMHFLGLGAKVHKAVDRVLSEHNANLLVDAVVYCDYFWPFYGYRVTGRVYALPSAPAQ